MTIITRNPPYSPLAVLVDDRLIEADTLPELYKAMRKYTPKGARWAGMTLQQIAEETGCSRQNVHQHLKNNAGNLQKIKKPQGDIKLVKEESFVNFSNRQLSTIYNIPTKVLKRRRSELGIKHISDSMFRSRQRNLCHLMFGKQFTPGVNFRVFIVTLMQQMKLTDRQKSLLTTFYFTKETESLSTKTYRYATARRKLQAYMRVRLSEKLLNKLVKLKYIERNKGRK